MSPPHNPQTGTVLPFGRPIEPDQLQRIYGDTDLPPIDLYRSLEEQRRIAAVEADSRRDIRIMRAQRWIAIACVVLAVAVAIYFGAQLGRGSL